MVVKYIKNTTAPLYKASSGQSREMVLIFGDEVEIKGDPVNGRYPSEYRGRPGFLDGKQLSSQPALEVYFIDVGQGDSTFIVTPNRKKILIDGGINKRAYGFLAWKYRFDQDGPPIDIDLLVLSHADGDHLEGLTPIIKHPRIHVHHIIHNGIATFQKEKFDTGLGDLDNTRKFLVSRHDNINDLNRKVLSDRFAAWHQAIEEEGTIYQVVDSRTGIIDIGDPAVSIEVLGPRLDIRNGQPVYKWLGGEAPTINGHSVVLKITCGKTSILAPGDLNGEGAQNLFVDSSLSSKLNAHIFKAPHHGSHDFYRPFLETTRPQVSVISSGDEPDYGHPRAVFIGALGQCSRSDKPLIFSIKIASNFIESAKEKAPEDKTDLKDLNPLAPNSDSSARILFKRRLHGMINVRTDGKSIFAARRIMGASAWESYGPLNPAD